MATGTTTTGEAALPSIDGTELIRVAKGSTNYKMLVSALVTYITSFLSGVVTSVFGRTGAVIALVADYAAFYLQFPVTKTHAQMVALIGSFNPGQQYIISDMATAQGTCSGKFTARTTSLLETIGTCTYQNGAMSAPMQFICEYELVADHIYTITHAATRQTVTENINDGMKMWPFDSPTYFEVTAYDPVVYVLDPAANVARCIFYGGNSLTIENASILTDVIAYHQSAIYLGSIASSALGGGVVGANSVVIMPRNANIYNFEIGQGQIFDLSNIAGGYTRYAKRLVDGESTFDVTPAENANVNVSSGAIDMAEFAFAGILLPDSGSVTLGEIANFPVHPIKIAPSVAAFGVQEKSIYGGAGNLQLEALVTITLDGTKGDFLIFERSKHDPFVTMSKTGGGQYITA